MTGIPSLDRYISLAIAFAPVAVTLCSVLAHFIPPTSLLGKLIGYIALNGGKMLVKQDSSALPLPKIPPAAVLVLVGLLSAGARAQTAVPGPTAAPVTASTFGGCVPSGKVCFGPSLAITAVAINVSKGIVEGSFTPGLGYGFSAFQGKWYSFGADVYGDVDPAHQQASVALLLKLVNGYVRIGASKGFIGDHSWRIPIGIGIDL